MMSESDVRRFREQYQDSVARWERNGKPDVANIYAVVVSALDVVLEDHNPAHREKEASNGNAIGTIGIDGAGESGLAAGASCA